MKFLTLAALALASSFSFAATKPLDCSAGNMSEDNYVQVTVSRSRVSITMHESHLEVRSRDFVASGNAIAILNKKLNMSAEGDSFTPVINALLVHDAAQKTLTVSLLIDGGVTSLASRVLTCK